jgi:hypothetical protein
VQVQAPETKKKKKKKKNLSAPRPTLSFIDVDLAASIDRATKMSLVCRCTGVVRWLHGGRTRPGPAFVCGYTLYRVPGTPRRGASTLAPPARRGYSKSTRIRAAELFSGWFFFRGPFVEPCVPTVHPPIPPSIDLLASAVRFILRRPCTAGHVHHHNAPHPCPYPSLLGLISRNLSREAPCYLQIQTRHASCCA